MTKPIQIDPSDLSVYAHLSKIPMASDRWLAVARGFGYDVRREAGKGWVALDFNNAISSHRLYSGAAEAIMEHALQSRNGLIDAKIAALRDQIRELEEMKANA